MDCETLPLFLITWDFIQTCTPQPALTSLSFSCCVSQSNWSPRKQNKRGKTILLLQRQTNPAYRAGTSSTPTGAIRGPAAQPSALQQSRNRCHQLRTASINEMAGRAHYLELRTWRAPNYCHARLQPPAASGGQEDEVRPPTCMWKCIRLHLYLAPDRRYRNERHTTNEHTKIT